MHSTRNIAAVLMVLLAVACEGRFKLHVNRQQDATAVDKFGLSTCVDPDPSKVAAGVNYSKCDGSIGAGTYTDTPGCNADAQVGCVSTANFLATVKADLDPTNIRYGVTYAGVTGTKRAIKHCKNGRGRTNQGGTTTVPWSGVINGAGTATVTSGSTVVNGTGTAFDDDLGPGDVITVSGQSRTVVSVSSQTLLNVDTNFTANAGPVAFTNYTPYLLNDVDDYQNNSAPYTGTDRTNCGGENFVDVTSATPPLQPSGAAGWTKIYQDQLTGQYFTNVFSATGFNQARLFCAGLDAHVTGGTGWRIPTVKEAAQLFVNGVALVSPALAAFNRLWTEGFNSGGMYVQIFRFRPYAASTGTIGVSTEFICVRE